MAGEEGPQLAGQSSFSQSSRMRCPPRLGKAAARVTVIQTCPSAPWLKQAHACRGKPWNEQLSPDFRSAFQPPKGKAAFRKAVIVAGR